MAGKKDQAVVVVIDGCTHIQAANIKADIEKSKAKHAPLARATASTGHRDDVGKRLSLQHESVRQLGSSKQNDAPKQIERKDGKSNGKKK